MEEKLFSLLGMLTVGLFLVLIHKKLGHWLYSVSWRKGSIIEHKPGGFIDKSYQYALLFAGVTTILVVVVAFFANFLQVN